MARPRKSRNGPRLRFNYVAPVRNRTRRSTSRTVSNPFAVQEMDCNTPETPHPRPATEYGSTSNPRHAPIATNSQTPDPDPVLPSSSSQDIFRPGSNSVDTTLPLTYANSGQQNNILKYTSGTIVPEVQKACITPSDDDIVLSSGRDPVTSAATVPKLCHPAASDHHENVTATNDSDSDDNDLFLQEEAEAKLLISSPFIMNTSNPDKARNYMTEWTTLYASPN